jgi:type VI secretion system protein ImpK
MNAAGAAVLPSSPAERGHRRGLLALALQEAFTTTVRLRANRQTAADAGSFRDHVKQLLTRAHEDARRAGYGGEDVKFAMYAVVVFLDESVLNSRHPAFVEWPRRPLQEELFGGHMGGETFFQNLHTLLARQDTDDLADVLEVYQLCLLLGFEGRYAAGGGDELRAWKVALADKMRRVRGGPSSLSPAWAPPSDVIPVPKDPWVRPLAYVAIGTLALSSLSALLFWIWQQSWIADLRGALR